MAEFIGYTGDTIAPGAGHYLSTQLFNPSGSGVLGFVKSVLITAPSLGTVIIGRSSGLFPGGTTSVGMNKVLGKPASLLQLDWVQALGGLNINLAEVGGWIDLLSAQYFEYDEPILIQEGQGFGVWQQSNNIPILTNFEWEER
jgi:hypothetical protein